MKITRTESFILGEREVLVRIETDNGLVGWGDATLEHRPGTVAAAVREMSGQLVGRDPIAVTRLWQRLSRGGFYRGGAVFGSALAGIDQALWDLRGRHFGAPVHELLGGPCRDRVRLYTHTWGATGHTGDPRRAAELVASGYTLVKASIAGPVAFLDTAASIDRFAGDLEQLRAAVGENADFAVDLHGRVSPAHARRLADAVAHTRPAFLEEPLRPEHTSHLARIVEQTSIPIAVGERLYSREELLPALEAGIAIAQPDLSHAGGITEVFRIAALAETFDAHIAPHCPLGPVALAACVQLDLAIPNFYAQEHVIDLTSAASPDLDILKNPEVLVADRGHLHRLTGPGLGIEIDEDAVRSRHRADLDVPRGNPQWEHADGSFAEW